MREAVVHQDDRWDMCIKFTQVQQQRLRVVDETILTVVMVKAGVEL